MKRTFSSLRYRNYRLFFAGQAVSQTGSWLQRIALGWYVLQLTHDPFSVGIMAVAAFGPFMALGLFAGVIADRVDARRLVIGTQAAQLAIGIALAWIALGGFARPWMLYTIAFASGVVLVLDIPSRQQLTYRMVGRDALPNAIALNSSLFNASRIFGPAVAGVMYGVAGPGVCFLVNALSFGAVLLSLFAMRTREFFPLEAFERPRILAGTREGVAFVLRQPRMVVVIGLTLVLGMFALNFNVTLPVLAYATLHTSSVVYGLLSAVFGAGALAGALVAASRGRASTRALIAGALVLAGAEAGIAPAGTPVAAGLLLFAMGAGFTLWTANSNAMLQLAAPDRLRGRVVGIYFYAFNGTAALGGLLAGWLCSHGGTLLEFLLAGGIGLVAAALAAARLRRIGAPAAAPAAIALSARP